MHDRRGSIVHGVACLQRLTERRTAFGLRPPLSLHEFVRHDVAELAAKSIDDWKLRDLAAETSRHPQPLAGGVRVATRSVELPPPPTNSLTYSPSGK
jgi:hypothetical protein